ncbi:MAG TPA: GNAT family N-acetyltransferase [Ktedonobacterales bacterium]|jgi:diamine N-acetyltransferase
MQRLTIRPVTRANWRAALRLSVLPEQQQFVSAYVPIAAIALAKGYIGDLGMQWSFHAFYRSEEMVGFVALAHKPEQSSVYWVVHFFIDARFQGKRLGKEALEALLTLIEQQHPACQVVKLTVDAENTVAQHLYTQAGFVPTDELLGDEPVYQLQVPR